MGQSASASQDSPTPQRLAPSGPPGRGRPLAHSGRSAPGRQRFAAPRADRAAWEGGSHPPGFPARSGQRLRRCRRGVARGSPGAGALPRAAQDVVSGDRPQPQRGHKSSWPSFGGRSTGVGVAGVCHPALSGGQTPSGYRPEGPAASRGQNPEQPCQGQGEGASGGAWTEPRPWESPAARAPDASAHPHPRGTGHLLPACGEPSRLPAARSPHVGAAPPRGTRATAEDIARLGHPAVLAPERCSPHLCHLGDRPRGCIPPNAQPGVDDAAGDGPREPQSVRGGLGVLEHKADTPRSGHDWPGCSKRNAVAVASVVYSSTMTTGSRWTLSTATSALRAGQPCQRSMDMATRRKRARRGTISRQVCVTSLERRRSGVRGNPHVPCWSSGRRGDPSPDCNRQSGTSRLRNQRQGRRTLAFSQAPRSPRWRSWRSVGLYNFCRGHSRLKSIQDTQLQHRSPAMAARLTSHLDCT
jgi:hypothetical protein